MTERKLTGATLSNMATEVGIGRRPLLKFAIPVGLLPLGIVAVAPIIGGHIEDPLHPGSVNVEKPRRIESFPGSLAAARTAPRLQSAAPRRRDSAIAPILDPVGRERRDVRFHGGVVPCPVRRRVDLGRHRLDSVEVTLRSDRETGFEDVHAQLHQLGRHPELLRHGHAASGRLFAVSKSRIEDVYSIRHTLIMPLVPWI
jgi:hypothetical protein